MALIQQKATITWSGTLREGSGELSVASGAFPDQQMTFKARTEGGEKLTTPEELIAAAHATCYVMVLSNLLTQNETPPGTLDVSAVCTLDRVDGALKITEMLLSVSGTVAGVKAADFERLAQEAEQRCPVSNALRGNVNIQVQAQLVGGR